MMRELVELVKSDPRYKLEAYLFVFEALRYAQEVLRFGREAVSEPLPGVDDEQEEAQPRRHVTGQELCEAARRYALDQYGLMAKTVLNSWGIFSTSDIGEIVYNLIKIGCMRKTREDRREHFDNVYDFQTAFRDGFRLCLDDAE